MLVLVVGPSGAGKDSLLNGARTAFARDARFHFVRRVITRPADPDGENHEPVSVAEFESRDFALSWSAHGLHYGIATAALTVAPIAVANVSRGIITSAIAAGHNARVIEVTAPVEVLAARLLARGREDAADMARRMRREVVVPAGVPLVTVVNDGSLEDGAARFVAALEALAAEASAA